MTKKRTEIRKAAGKLVLAIQKEWIREAGNLWQHKSEEVMNHAHDLLAASSAKEMKELLGQKSVKMFLGNFWVEEHPAVRSAIEGLESAIAKDKP
jgi:hypothetical protein